MPVPFSELDRLSINTLRTLAMDAVEEAASGHPGAPMALAPLAHVLFTRVLKHDPTDPGWPDRDRFVLSAGHASMLLYGVLHLTGYDLGRDELRRFRQWGSRTPGHPEYGLTPGVETTTGPLGQGCGNSVGMALAEAHLAARYNRDGFQVVDHRTWAVCSDGDLMEGVSAEAASLAGRLGLGKLTWIWDDNRITIEGGTDLAFTEDVLGRFRAYGWHVESVDDVNDLAAIEAACRAAMAVTDRPSFIRVRSHIAFGAPTKQDSADAHGAPLGAAEVAGAKRAYGWPEDARFLVPAEAAEHCRREAARGAGRRQAWSELMTRYRGAHPDAAAELARRLAGKLPEGWDADLPVFPVDAAPVATRAASGKALNALAARLPELMGGSADLAPSTKTLLAGGGDVGPDAWGNRNLHFGVREHAMGALLNGLALHGGVRPYGATFLVFADYMRPAIRLAALMRLPVVYVFTHDSIAVGEDGPTHQPVDQLLSLRAIPGLVVLRPADANETAAAWRAAVARCDGPVALVLTRQALPVLDGSPAGARAGVARGGWIAAEAGGGRPALILLASGSEVQLAAAARERLEAEGVPVRLVSLPSWELLAAQGEDYRRELLAEGVPRLAVEAGRTLGWEHWVGAGGAVLGLDRFGASAPWREVYANLGFTVEAVVERAHGLLGRT